MVDHFWSRERVLITGASGLVGSWLTKELLNRNASVVALVRDADPQTEFVRSGDICRTTVVSGDLRDFATVERAINENEISTVFHLGAQTIVDAAQRSPLQTFEANIRGTYNLLEACRLHPGLIKRVVMASSDKAYGDSETLPYVESMPLNGRHPYEVSKSCADLLAQSYAKSFDSPICVARCGNIFGGGDLNWSRIVPSTIRSFLRNESPVVRSDGSFIRDYIFVDDVVSAYLQMAERFTPSLTGEAFNISLEAPLTVLELIQEIAEIMNTKSLKPVIQNRAQGELKSQYLDARKASQLLDWKPKYSLSQGLEKTVAWYRQFLDKQLDS